MTSRVDPSRLISVPVRSLSGSRKETGPVEVRQPDRAEDPKRAHARDRVAVPWSNAYGFELYKQVQRLPEGLSTGSPELTPQETEAAKASGVGRTVDTYA